MLVLIVAGDRTTPAGQANCTSIVEQLQRVDWSEQAPRIHIVPDADTGRWLLRSITGVMGEDPAADARPAEAPETAPATTEPDTGSWPAVDRRSRSADRRQSRPRVTVAVDRRAAGGGAKSGVRQDPSRDEPLLCTEREQEIVHLIRQGLTNKQIAHRLGIVEDTVKKHLQHIYDKLGVRRRALVMLGRPDHGDADGGHTPFG